MARIFSINFLYNERMQNAIVSVRHTPFFTEYTLNVFDEEVARLLPGKKILSTSRDHYVFENAGANSNTLLMERIITAVSQHLHATME